jgi:hypothetical protein
MWVFRSKPNVMSHLTIQYCPIIANCAVVLVGITECVTFNSLHLQSLAYVNQSKVL